MIIKIPDYQTAIDAINRLLESGQVQGEIKQQLKFEAAGLVAEQQMAYQLTSYFQNSEDLYVYNNLAIQNGAVTTQIDHFVFSRRTLYLIESKSVSGAINVNQAGEFQRLYGTKVVSINSPIEQVKRQREVFLDFLRVHRQEFLGKVLFMQKGLSSWTPKYFVAISEKGMIKGPGRSQIPELMKYDHIASAISEHHNKTDVGLLKSLDDKSAETFNLFNRKELERLCCFLKESDISQSPIDKIKKLIGQPRYHKDVLPESTHAAKSPSSEIKALSSDGFACGKCGSHNLQIAFGKSYYFKCGDCGGNTPIKLTCDNCEGLMRTRKQKNEFFKVCNKCGIDQPYFVNR